MVHSSFHVLDMDGNICIHYQEKAQINCGVCMAKYPHYNKHMRLLQNSNFVIVMNTLNRKPQLTKSGSFTTPKL